MSYLPLRYDKPEARINHELLVDLVLEYPDLIIKGDGERIIRLIKIYGNILDTKLSNA